MLKGLRLISIAPRQSFTDLYDKIAAVVIGMFYIQRATELSWYGPQGNPQGLTIVGLRAWDNFCQSAEVKSQITF